MDITCKEKHIPWNKGKHIYCGGKRFEKGHHSSTEFKKGNIPWYKDKSRPEFSGKNHPMFGKHHTEERKSVV